MKTIKTTIIALVAVFSLVSCKKDKANESEKTTTQKVQAKWNFTSQVTISTIPNEERNETITGKTGDYVEFRNDGKYTSKIDADVETDVYTIDSDSQITLV